MHLIILDARAPIELERVFATIDRQHIGALVSAEDPLFLDQSAALAALAATQRISAIYPYRQAADAGGLISCGIDVRAAWHLAGVYAGRILGGDKPADLPLRQVDGADTVLNLRAAKGLGVTMLT